MVTPRLSAPELTAGQFLPETTVNEQTRIVEQGAGHFIFEDRDLATPPVSPADGDCYLVAAGGADDWFGQDGNIAFWLNTEWKIIPPFEGLTAWVIDEQILLFFNGSTWETLTAPERPAQTTTQSGTTYTAALGDANGYVRFTNAAAITFTIPPNSDVAFPLDTVIAIEQAGAGVVTIAAGVGVTRQSRNSQYDTAGQFAVAQIKQVAADIWTIIGDVV